jgi:mRNA-degrading endonuclease toxin of MazEF toxin-antitoxin module
MDLKQGDIFLYEPPAESSGDQGALLAQSGHEQSGLRPYVIVSRELVHTGKPTAVAVPLSTKTHKANSYRIALPASELLPDLGREPFKDSVALCDHVRVIDVSRLRKKIGRLSDNATLAVGLGLAFVFDLR